MVTGLSHDLERGFGHPHHGGCADGVRSDDAAGGIDRKSTVDGDVVIFHHLEMLRRLPAAKNPEASPIPTSSTDHTFQTGRSPSRVLDAVSFKELLRRIPVRAQNRRIAENAERFLPVDRDVVLDPGGLFAERLAFSSEAKIMAQAPSLCEHM